MKKKNILKATLAFAMACTMGLSVCAPAFAAETEITAPGTDGTYGGSLEFDGTLATPTIKITLPASSGLSINPYNLDVSIGNDGSDAIISDEGVLSPIYGIESESNAALAIGVIGTLTAPEGTADAPNEVVINTEGFIEVLEEPTGEKQVYAYIEFGTGAKSTDVSEGQDGSEIEYGGTFIGAYAKQPNQYLLPESNDEGTLPTVIGTLPAYTDTNDNGAFDDGTDTAGLAVFTFGGDAQMNTAKAWTANDKVKATVIFSFNPLGDSMIIRPGATDMGELYTVVVTDNGGGTGTIAFTLPTAVEGDAVRVPVKLNNSVLRDKDDTSVTYIEFAVVNTTPSSDTPTWGWALTNASQEELTLVEKLDGNAETVFTVTPGPQTTT